MVNSKDFIEDYSGYYRPTPDHNDPDFFAVQGTLPLYYFKNGVLQYSLKNDYNNALLKEDYNNVHYITIIYIKYCIIFIIIYLILIFRK